MKSKRFFLEAFKHSDSYIRVDVSADNGELCLKLSDCDRRIWWNFGKPGDKRSIAKIKTIKACFDEIHAYLTGEAV